MKTNFFVKYSAEHLLLNQYANPSITGNVTFSELFDTRKWKQTFFAYFKHNREPGLHTQKPGLDLQLIASHPGFQFEAEFFPAFKAAY